ncbi:class I SAM-dependent methyltransferase [archaeon]|nr:class I SAM-dependent methyltransferase [archaeon]MBT4022241.1 class I SAM-dependent methyltransferase [archaeon]MBT4460648.1 class I SAM-dependent methyltransferase [archaeon]MBT5424530.1 class I SAM-dependent methyltransferase [archaeon]MBT7439612.1 class I SAM-dependent methyltransferase [archaeon]
MKCRICGSESRMFLDFGKMPLANAFLKKEDLAKEEAKYPLALSYCDTCKIVQLTEAISGKKLFKNYVYVSSTAKSFRIHFNELATKLKFKLQLNENSLAVDIGSNDGVLLKEYKKSNIPFIGVEPAENIAKLANEQGLETINAFFNKEVVNEIIDQKGKADVITACNVFAHIEQIHEVIDNVKLLLKDSGTFVIEIQYFIDTIKTMTFDNVYHEHLFYYTVHSLDFLFKKHGLQIEHIEHVDTHGGSLRVFIKKEAIPDETYFQYLETEGRDKVAEFHTYELFAEKVNFTKKNIVELIKRIKKKDQKIVGYGAPAKASTLLNFCNIGKEGITYIIDDNPLKQNLFTPGNKIPVKDFSHIKEDPPNYIIILAWNFFNPIMNKINKIYPQKFKFILPLPSPKII